MGLLTLLLGYAVLQIAVGLWVGRRVGGAGDFFVAGRSLGPGLLCATLLAANVGAGSTVGAAGLGYRDGLAAWWWVGSAAAGTLVLAFTVGPRMRAVAARHGLRTTGDYLQHRYGSGVRGAISLLLWLGSLAILSGQLVALAWVLNVVAGWPKWAGCLAGGLVATTYSAAGGLLTSVYVNVVQVVVKLSGFALAIPLVLARAGGLGAVAAATANPADFWSPWQGGESGPLLLALLAPAFVVSPGILQKIYGAKDDRAVRRGAAVTALALFVFAWIPALLGMAARALHPGLSHHELALPTVLLNDLPPLLGALGLAAVVSAEISSADAVLFMLSTSLSQDLYHGFVNPGATERQVLRVARGATVLAGALGVLIAVAAPTVIAILSVFYSLLGVSLFVPVVGGLYVPRAGTREAASAIGAGCLTLLLAQSPLLGLAAAALAFGIVLALRRA